MMEPGDAPGAERRSIPFADLCFLVFLDMLSILSQIPPLFCTLIWSEVRSRL